MNTEYKKGDRVRRANVGNGAYGAKIGQEATVVSADSRMVYVDYAPRNPCSYAINEPEGWYRENVELIVEPSLKVGDKVAYRHRPDKQAGEVVAVIPQALPATRAVIFLGDSSIALRYQDGKVYGDTEYQNDFVLVRKPVLTKKAYICGWVNSGGNVSYVAYPDKKSAELCKSDMQRNGKPASVTEVDVTVDPN